MTAKSITDSSGRDPLVSAVEIIKVRLMRTCVCGWLGVILFRDLAHFGCQKETHTNSNVFLSLCYCLL